MDIEQRTLHDHTALIRLFCPAKQARAFLEAQGYRVLEISEASASSENDRIFSMALVEQCNAVELWRPRVNEVYCMDALMLLGQMESQSVDAIIIDPPYNMTELDFETVFDWRAFWVQTRRILSSSNCPTIVFSQQPFTTDLINTNRKAYRNEIIYEKALPTGFLNANRRPLQAHENIILFSDKSPDYFPQMEESSIRRHPTENGREISGHYRHHEAVSWTDNGKRYPRSVWKFAQRKNAFHQTETLHLTEKPLLLLERIIATYTKPDDLVLDCFAGSGGTLLAARNLGRRYIGCDITPEYISICKSRLQKPWNLSLFEEAS